MISREKKSRIFIQFQVKIWIQVPIMMNHNKISKSVFYFIRIEIVESFIQYKYMNMNKDMQYAQLEFMNALEIPMNSR